MKFGNLILQELQSWTIELCRWIPGRVGLHLRANMFRKRMREFGKNGYISQGVWVYGWKNIALGHNVTIGVNSILTSSEGVLSIGNYSGLNSNVTVNADLGSINIGNNVIVGMNTVLRAANHKFEQSPKIPIRDQGHDWGEIFIHDDVWIGANVTILPNVTIGSHCVIAAGSVVTKDIPSQSLAAGVPARVIRKIT